MDRIIGPFSLRYYRAARSAAYVLATVASLAATAAESRAAIHYYFGDLAVAPRTEQPLDINLEGDDFDDIVLMNYAYADGNYQGAFIPYEPGRVVGFNVGVTEYVTALETGAMIGPTTLGLAYEATLAYGAQAPHAQFKNAKNAYLGFAFPIGPTDLHYAWLRVDVDNAAGEFLLKDWAYEDQAGVGIVAGDVGTLPIPGDFDSDGLVDGHDLAIWSAHFGQEGVPADGDANLNGVVDGADFLAWQQHFDLGSPPTLAPVPEPGAASLLLMGAALFHRRRFGSRRPAPWVASTAWGPVDEF